MQVFARLPSVAPEHTHHALQPRHPKEAVLALPPPRWNFDAACSGTSAQNEYKAMSRNKTRVQYTMVTSFTVFHKHSNASLHDSSLKPPKLWLHLHLSQVITGLT